MNKTEFIRILNHTLDIQRNIDKSLVKKGTLSKKEYFLHESVRNNFAIDLKFYLDLENIYDDIFDK